MGVCLGLFLLPVGCATRGSVLRLQEQVATLQAKVDAQSRDLSQVTATLKDSETRAGQQARGLDAVGQRVERLERLDARLDDLDKTLKDVKASVEALRPQVSRLSAQPAETAEKAYQSAQTYYQAGNYGQAVLEFTDLIQSFSRHPLAENAQYWMGASYLASRDYRQALVEFQKVLDLYPGGRKAPDALYQIGLAYRNLFEPAKARETWQQLIRRFPDSDAARQARAALRTGTAARRPG